MPRLGEELEDWHCKLCEAITPFSFMITRRKYSPSGLDEVLLKLERLIQEIRKWQKKQ